MRLLPTENFRSPGALGRFFLTMLIGLSLDLWTKAQAFEHLAASVTFDNTGRVHVTSRTPDPQLIPGWLHLHVTGNQGAVFGKGQGLVWLFVSVSLAATIYLIYLFANSGRQRLYQFVLGMLLAGVLGNLYDRIFHKFVRDMLFGLPNWYWPNSNREVFPWIFNVADMLLVCGVGLMILHFLRAKSLSPAQGAQVQVPAKNG